MLLWAMVDLSVNTKTARVGEARSIGTDPKSEPRVFYT